MPLKPRKGGHHVFCSKAPKKLLFFIFICFESEFGFNPKTSGLNPWSFQFWGYPRLGSRAKLASGH